MTYFAESSTAHFFREDRETMSEPRKSPKGTKGGKHANGVPYYGVDNYRPDGGRVIGDLYDQEGNFHRSAVVADCGSEYAAKKYCEEKNK